MNASDLWALATRPRARRRRSRSALRRALNAQDAATQLAAAALATRPEIEAPLELVANLTRRALHAATQDVVAAAEALIRGSALPLAQSLVSVLPERLDTSTAGAVAATVSRVYQGQKLPSLPPHPHDTTWAIQVGAKSAEATRRAEVVILGDKSIRATELLLSALIRAESLSIEAASKLTELIWQRRNDPDLGRYGRTLGCSYALLARHCGKEKEVMEKIGSIDRFVMACLPVLVKDDGELALMAIEVTKNQISRILRLEFARIAGTANLMKRATELLQDDTSDSAVITSIFTVIADILPYEDNVLEWSAWQTFIDILINESINDDAALLAGAAFVRYASFAPIEIRRELSSSLVRKLAIRMRNSIPVRAGMAIIDAVASEGDPVETAHILAETKTTISFALLMRLAVRCDIEVLDEVLDVAEKVIHLKDVRSARVAVLGADAGRKDALVAWFLRLGQSRSAKL